MLSTNIQFSSLDRDVRTLLVTSVSPDEGKSIVLANLAITMAEGGRKVIVVDCGPASAVASHHLRCA